MSINKIDESVSTTIADVACVIAAIDMKTTVITVEPVRNSLNEEVEFSPGRLQFCFFIKGPNVTSTWNKLHRVNDEVIEVKDSVEFALNVTAVKSELLKRVNKLQNKETSNNVIKCWEIKTRRIFSKKS